MKLLLPLLFLTLISSCTLLNSEDVVNEQTLLGSWRMITQENTSNKKVKDGLLNDAKNHELVQHSPIYSFFEDGTFSYLQKNGVYKTGTWKLENDASVLALKEKNGQKNWEFSVKQESNKPTEISISDTKTKQTFGFYAKRVKKYEEDQFHPSNNEWRIKPKRAESPKEIHRRISNYIRHYAYILKNASERKQQIVSFEYSLGIVRIYDGGIGVIDFEYVPETWKNCFYSVEQAKEGRQVYLDAILSSHYGGYTSRDWILDDYRLLLNIYGDLVENEKTIGH